MRKELLLAKSNIKKKKGNCICITILMILAVMLSAVSFLLVLDAYPNTNKYASKLNAAEGSAIIYNNLDGIDNTYIDSLINEYVDEYQVTEYMCFPNASFKFGKGELECHLMLIDDTVFNKKISRTEIVKEKKSISENYVYVPYQLYTTGGYDIGDSITIPFDGVKRSFIVKGFTNNIPYGNNNCGIFEFVLNNDDYAEISSTSSKYNALEVAYKTNNKINPDKLNVLLYNGMLTKNTKVLVLTSTFDDVVDNRGFMSLILGIAFTIITCILLIIIVLMLLNSISNFVKESMKEIGALKAIGYTSTNIRGSILIQFLFLSIIGAAAGVLLAYITMPLFANMIIAQQGLPYSVSFNFAATFVPITFNILFTLLIAYLSTMKIKRIDPIVALRNGEQSHSFKKNRIPLEKSKLSLNVSLALKTLFDNMKQNIITFIIVGFLTFNCVISLLMFENFNRNPNLELLTFETCGGVVAVEADKKDEAVTYLNNKDGVENVRYIIGMSLIYGDNDAEFMANVMDDINKLNNKNVCYKGHLPKYDNEIVISGKFAREEKIKIGDEIRFTYGSNSYNYLVTGYIQTTNNGGKECLLNTDAASHIMNLDEMPGAYYFDCKRKDVAQILNDFDLEFGNSVVASLNFYEIIDGAMTTFKTISATMLAVSAVISIVIIVLVLYLLIKSLLHNKRKEYGIYKSLGFSNKDLILQTTLSFMPSIILSSIIFSIISYYSANLFMNIIMINFGVVKCTFTIPVGGVIIILLSLVVISFLATLFESRRIKNIEPYKLLLAE